MTTLTITRGLPGSGKTTFREARLRLGDPEGCAMVGVSRDDLRLALFNHRGRMDKADEDWLTGQHRAVVERHLRTGVSVFVDDTNLRDHACREWRDLAKECSAQFDIVDLRGTPLNVCLQRVADRASAGGHHVFDKWIRESYDRFIKGRDLDAPLAENPVRKPGLTQFEKHVHQAGLPGCWLFDVDGTLALCGDRDIYDASKAHLDTPNTAVADMARLLDTAGQTVVVVTARHETHRKVTKDWLDANHVPHAALFMRRDGDYRKDQKVKNEILREQIEPRWNVRGVFDDRQRVVDMWRATGITCFQVAEGNF